MDQRDYMALNINSQPKSNDFSPVMMIPMTDVGKWSKN